MNAHSGPRLPAPFANFDPDTSCWRTWQPSLLPESLPEQPPTFPRSGMWDSGAAYELPTSEPPTDEPESSSLLPTPEAYQGSRGGSQHPDKRQAGGHAVSLQDVTEHVLLGTPRVGGMGNGPSQREIDEGDPKHRLETQVAILAGQALLPTPRATDGSKGGPNQRGSSGDLMLPSAVQSLLPTPRATRGGSATETMALLPTPNASVSQDGESFETWEVRRQAALAKGYNGNGIGMPLTIAVQLIGEPTSPPSDDGNES